MAGGTDREFPIPRCPPSEGLPLGHINVSDIAKMCRAARNILCVAHLPCVCVCRVLSVLEARWIELLSGDRLTIFFIHQYSFEEQPQPMNNAKLHPSSYHFPNRHSSINRAPNRSRLAGPGGTRGHVTPLTSQPHLKVRVYPPLTAIKAAQPGYRQI